MCFFYARDGGCPRWGPEMGSGTSAIDGVRHFARYGVRHFARDGVRHLCQIRGQALYPRWGQTPLPEMGSGTSVRDGVRHLCPRWGQALWQRRGQALWQRRGQAPLSEMGSGTSACGGVRHFARDGVRHLCLRWGLTPEGIVTYLHLRFILRCFIIVGAGDSTNIA